MFYTNKTKTIRTNTKYKPLTIIKTGIIAVTLLCTGLLVSNNQPPAYAAELCYKDAQGANDEPNQKDLTRACYEKTGLPDYITVKWQWDELATSGNNSMDGCALFDTDGDGLVNYAACVTTKNEGTNKDEHAVFDALTMYSCGDNTVDRCSQPLQVIPNGLNTCTVTQQSSDPFPIGSENPIDTVASCTIYLSTIGSGAAQLIDACSYPSQQPNSDPSDCVLIDKGLAKLSVVKSLVPATDSGTFNLQVNGTTKATGGNLTDTGTIVVDAGANLVGETAASGALSDYTTAIECRDLHGTGAVVGSSTGGTLLNVTVAENADILCTITNTRKAGQITVVKEVTNDNGGTKKVADFPLFINGTSTTSGVAKTLSPGTYTVSETNQAGYHQKSLTCVDSSTGQAVAHPVELGDDQNVTCTIVNDDRPATLTVVKTFANQYGGTTNPADFSFTINSGAQTAFEADGSNQLSVNADTYNVAETPKGGFAAPSYSGCSGIVLSVGGSATCTITNSDLPATLIVKKIVINDDGGTATADDFSFQVNDASAVKFEKDGQNDLLLASGTYGVVEADAPGYATTYNNCQELVIANGQTQTCTITNNDIAPTLTLVKAVTNDDGGTATATNWTLTAQSTDATLPVPSGKTGEAAVTNVVVKAGVAYALSEADGPTGYASEGWQCTAGIMKDGAVTLALAQNATCTITNNDIAPKLTVRKVTEPASSTQAFSFVVTNLVGDTPFALDTNADTVTPNERTFTALRAGTTTISEQSTEGWVLAAASCDTARAELNGSTLQLELSPGQDVTCTFTNSQLGSVEVTKFRDTNENGILDDTEELLPDWEMNLSESCEGAECEAFTSKVTNQDGVAIFEGVSSGSYVLSETLQDGWLQTGMYCGEPGETPINTNNLSLRLGAGATQRCYVGNTQPLRLLLAKTNNASSVKQVGDTVLYTLVVTNPEDSGYASDATVTDTPPEGFKYVLGSWTAASNIRGDLKTGGVTTEPTYASPGDWNLGDMLPGEIVTLTYLTKIIAASDGIYPDSAFASAGSVLGASTVFSNLSLTPDNPFVGTQVTVDSPLVPGPVQRAGVVLGASTTLQNTGEKIISSLLFALGIIAVSVIVFARKKKRTLAYNGIRTSALLLVFGLVLFAGGTAQAATYWTTNISTPEAQTTTGVFGIDFQVLSTTPSDTFTVQLYQNGIVIATQNIATDNGDSGSFPISLTSDGTYNYFTKTQHGSDVSDVKTSPTLTVQFDRTAPAAPTQVTKTTTTGGYVLNFLVPGGTESSQVQVFASSSTTFIADASTLVRTMAATPGVVQSTALGVSDGQPRYFAVRTVDAFGNTSALVTESPQVQAAATTTTTGAVQGASTALSASAAQGAVNGANTTLDADKTLQTQNTTSASNGEVLGLETESKTTPAAKQNATNGRGLIWVVALGVPAIIAAVLLLTRKKTS